ncbi:MAG TPA: type I glyceraldehyde-3-phosphate dehydrogenase [Anaerolineae bacterium]|nr:type I glyceraldehyde-3-phosphate dehydrogenase [Anaerolineae bacterium]
MAKVAINGLGRIGRATLKILMDKPELELVGVNDIASKENIAYLISYDTVYRKYGKQVKVDEGNLVIGGEKISFLSERDPQNLPWGKLDVDLVFECTGFFTKTEDAEKHLKAGAKFVIVSGPTKSKDMPTVVYGVNDPSGDVRIISCASCTTNNIAPVVEILGRRIGIKKAVMTTIHGYTSTQSIVDGPNKSFRRGRAAATNLVPTTTGAAIATTKALPQFEGKFGGVAVRVPVPVGSIADMVFLMKRDTTAEEVNNILQEEAQTERYREVLGVTDEPIVSSDIIQDPRASIVDLKMTNVIDGDLVKVLSWYDNEWGYSYQMVRQALEILA